MQRKSDGLYYGVGNCGDLRRKSDEKEITRIFNDFTIVTDIKNKVYEQKYI